MASAGRRLSCMSLCLFLCLAHGICLGTIMRACAEDQLPSKTTRPGSSISTGLGANPNTGTRRLDNRLEVRFKNSPQTESSILKLGDMIDVVSWGQRSREQLLEMPLAPAPQLGAAQDWSADEIIHHLELRGVPASQIKWTGPTTARLMRVQRSLNKAANSLTARPQLMPAFVQDRTIAQAEANLTQAIRNYLGMQSGQRTDWRIQLRVPVEHAAALAIERNILSVGGGNEPWTGLQEITFIFLDRGKEYELILTCDVQLPPMVVVAVSSLRRDQVLSQDDLAYAALPERSSDQLGELAQSIDELIGKQLRRSMSTGQPIPKSAIAHPKVISAGEAIQVESVSGLVSVKTAAKALASGAVGELISVELLPSRQRLHATVMGPREARIVASAPLVRHDPQPAAERADSGRTTKPTVPPFARTANITSSGPEYR